MAHRRVLRGSAFAGAALLLVAGMGALLVSEDAAERLLHPPRKDPPITPAHDGIPFERVRFASGDGLALAGWWMPAEDANGTVVFLHGYGATKAQSLAVAPFLHEAGYNVLAFDFRAHGDSEGAFTSVGLLETRDVRAAVRYLAQRGDVDMSRVALFGWSMGAAAALNAAPALPEVRAVVADSGFASLSNVVGANFEAFTGLPRYPFAPLIVSLASWKAGVEPGDNAPALQAARLDRPVLIIQGAQDPVVRPERNGERIADAAGEWAVYWLVPQAGHVNARAAVPEQYERTVLAFLREALA